MTVSREDIDKAEGALRLAEATLAGDEAQIVAIRAQIAALDPSNTSERAELAVQIQSLQPSVERDRIAVDQAKATLARLRSDLRCLPRTCPEFPQTNLRPTTDTFQQRQSLTLFSARNGTEQPRWSVKQCRKS